MKVVCYEFDSVKDREGNDKINSMFHANPVQVVFMAVGRCAIFSYADRPDLSYFTSPIEELYIHAGSIHMITENSEYWLEQRIKEV